MDFLDEKDPDGNWLQWAKFVLKTLKAHDDMLERLKENESNDRIKFVEFKTKVETRSSTISAIIAVIVSISINILVTLLLRVI